MCPCYLLNPGNSSAPSQGQSPSPPNNAGQGYPMYGIIGFIPVVFVPSCPGNNTDMQTAQQSFPTAVPVPYNCGQCQAGRDVYRYLGRANGGRSVDLGDLKEIRSVTELESLLRKHIKPMKKSLRRISVHPIILDKTNEDNGVKSKTTKKNKQ